MTQGTTPTLTVHLTEPAPDLTAQKRVSLTLAQGDQALTVKSPDPRLEVAERSVRLTLTQEETLRFAPGAVQLQLRWLEHSGGAGASRIGVVMNRGLLRKEVLR